MSRLDFGILEVIAGCMYASKSTQLVQRLQHARYEKKAVAAFKPGIDARYSRTDITSHNGLRFAGIPVSTPSDIYDTPTITAADVVGIDEVQFFDGSIVDVCQNLVGQGKRVIVAGLDQDFRGQPFGPMPTLLALADFVTKVHAACTVCGGFASKSQRIVDSTEQVLPGGKDVYEARCRRHWSPEPIFAQQEREVREDLDG